MPKRRPEVFEGNRMAQSMVGLDISSRRLLAVEIDGVGGKRPTLVRAHQVELAPTDARDSEVLDVPAVGDALKRLWNEAGFKSKRAVLGVGNQRVLVREHTVPVLPLAQLRASLPYQVADLLPVPVEETILDFYPVEEVAGSEPPAMRGLLVAALTEAVETNVAALTAAKLGVAGVDLSAFAIVRALAPTGELAGTHTIVAIGARTSHIIVVRDGVPRFVRIIPSGGESVTDAIEPQVTEGRAAAEAVKWRLGLDGVAHPQYAALSRAMFDSLNGLINAVRSTNSYYVSSDHGGTIDSIILIGTEAQVPGLPRAIAENVGLAVRVGDPLTGIVLGRDLTPESLAPLGPDLAVPIGLALGGE